MTTDDTAPAVVAADLADAVPDLCGLLNGSEVERVATVPAIRRTVTDAGPDCVVVTAKTPAGAWRRGVDAVRAVEPTLPVVLVTADGSERLAAAAVEADVAAYVNLAAGSDPGDRLAAAVEAAVERGSGDRPARSGSDTERVRPADYYRTLVETVPDVIFVFDAEGIVETTNERATDVFGVDRADLIGRSYTDLLDADVVGREAVDRYLETVARLLDSDTDTPGRFEVTLTTPDGRDRTYEVHVTLRSADGAFGGTVGVMRDITARTRRQAELERQNERLERFASVVSHDLRNPLEVARGRLELARERGDDRHLDHVDGAIDRMETIVDDLLALARQGTAVQDTQLVRLDRIARSAWEVVETGEATLTVASDCTVRADGSRLQQLFENCFRNSVEHGDHDDSTPPVSVRVGLLADDGRPDGFYVEDDGPGIPADQRDHLFEYGSAGSDGGMGLGLAIVKDIVDAHDWRIRVADADSSGARFEITGVTVREQ